MCVVKGCTQAIRGKAIMCAEHWFALPQQLREDLRNGTDKGLHTLRANPSKEWLASASKHVGDLRHIAVRPGAEGKAKKKFQDNKQASEPQRS